MAPLPHMDCSLCSPELERDPPFPEPPRNDLPTVGNCVGVIPPPREFALATNGT